MAMQKQTLTELLSHAVKRSPDAEAIVFPNARFTYQQFQDRIDAAARSLLGMEIQRGDVIGILMPNCAENVITLFAAAKIGVLCVTINNRFRPRELGHVITDSGMKALFTSDLVAEQVDYAERIQQTLPELADAKPGTTPAAAAAPALKYAVLLGTSSANGLYTEEQFKAFTDAVSAEQLATAASQVTADDPLLMLYTSGTTAMPKGCPLSHDQITRTCIKIAEYLSLNDNDRMWNALPMFHASSLLPMIATLHSGATFISQLHFSADETLHQLVDEKATYAWPAYDLIWQQILTHPEFDPAKLANIRGLLIVGPPETLINMEKILPNARILSCYGITEVSGLPIMSRYSDDQDIRLRTCGMPFDGMEAQVRDPETQKELPAGQRGLLWMRGPMVIKGYWQDAEKTAASFDADGWFNTGDIVSKDERGYVAFHGRLKDTLKVGGENVAAVEVEAFLTTHPAVKTAAVVGVPDAKYGEVPAAFIEFRPGASASAEELIQFCKDSLSGFKVPRHIRFVTEWPMSATKIRKDDLRTPLLAELGIEDTQK